MLDQVAQVQQVYQEVIQILAVMEQNLMRLMVLVAVADQLQVVMVLPLELELGDFMAEPVVQAGQRDQVIVVIQGQGHRD
jgi:hypothetical protein